jgi:hypothetical protein
MSDVCSIGHGKIVGCVVIVVATHTAHVTDVQRGWNIDCYRPLVIKRYAGVPTVYLKDVRVA